MMESIDVDTLIAAGSFGLAVCTSIVAAALWYAKSEKRKYGLERDFAHLKRNYEQIESSLETILSEIDHQFDIVSRDILEIKSTLNNQRK